MPINFPSSPSTNDLYSYNGSVWKWTGYGWITLNAATSLPRSIKSILANVGDLAFVQIPYSATITSATISGHGASGQALTGSAVVNIWRDTAANYPPTVTDSIVASVKPSLSGQSLVVYTSLTGWNTSITAGDWLVFSLESMSTISTAQCFINVFPS